VDHSDDRGNPVTNEWAFSYEEIHDAGGYVFVPKDPLRLERR
jgi:hypothetical protein